MEKEILQITIEKAEPPKTKFGRWWYWNVYWRVWQLWRPRVMSKFYRAVSNAMLSILPKEKREELRKEYDEVEVHIVDEGGDESVKQAVIDSLTATGGVYCGEEMKEKARKELKNLLNN